MLNARNEALAKVIPHRFSTTNTRYEDLRTTAPLWVAWYEQSIDENTGKRPMVATIDKDDGLATFFDVIL